MLNDSVRQYLQSHQAYFLDELKALLSIPSIANVEGGTGGEPCRRAATWLARHLERMGLRVELAPMNGGPACVLGTGPQIPGRPTLLLYGHYDVQPAEPLEHWVSPPFEPTVRDGAVYARGADDDKGQLFAHLMAIQAWQHAGGGLPVNLKLLLEGEEEVGSPHLEGFIVANADRLRADVAALSDSEFFAPGVPAITYGLRGLVAAELTVYGPRVDVHSGVHGGAVRNPVNALAAIVAAMHDANGRVAIPGFYDAVAPLQERERREWSQLGFDEPGYAVGLGLEHLGGGERDYAVLERLWARPTLDCNGIIGGYTGQGSKTIIPSKASVKITMRLVNDQDPQAIFDALKRFVAKKTPVGVRAQLEPGSMARPVLLAPDSPAMQAARTAYEEGFGTRPSMIRCGASIPVVELLQRRLGLEAVVMGFGLEEDSLHSPNEHFLLSQLWGGALTSAAFMQALAEWAKG